MIQKEYSLSQKAGYQDYCRHSWILLPKMGGTTSRAVLFYSVLIGIVYLVRENHGIENTLNSWHLVMKK
jgi:hypothetical protein